MISSAHRRRAPSARRRIALNSAVRLARLLTPANGSSATGSAVRDSNSDVPLVPTGEDQPVESDDDSQSDRAPSHNEQSQCLNHEFLPEFEITCELGPQPPVPVYRQLKNDIALFLLAQKLRHNHSEIALQRAFAAASALCGQSNLRISLHEVRELEQALLQSVRPIVQYFCECDEPIASLSSPCRTNTCTGTTRRRSTPSEVRAVCVFDIAVQLQRILTQNIDEIEALHSQLHRGGHWRNRADTINSDYFKVNLETPNEFRMLNWIVQATINLDGTFFKGNYNGQFWPLTLAVIDLPPGIRFAKSNLVVCGFYRGPNKPSQKALNVLLEGLRENFHRNLPIRVHTGRRLIRIDVEITYTSLDLEAAQLAYCHHSYSRGLCHYCRCKAAYRDHAYRYPPRSGRTRNAQWISWTSAYGNNGFTHDLMQGKRRPELRIGRNTKMAINDLSSTILLPTYYVTRLLPISKHRRFSGKEVSAHVLISLPILSLSRKFPEIKATAATLLLAYAYSLLLFSRESDDVMLVADIYQELRDLWTDIFSPNTVTYKVHLLLCHLPQLLRERLSVYGFSTTAFEQMNYHLKNVLSTRNTAGFDITAIARLALWGPVHNMISERGPLTHLQELRDLDNQISTEKLVFSLATLFGFASCLERRRLRMISVWIWNQLSNETQPLGSTTFSLQWSRKSSIVQFVITLELRGKLNVFLRTSIGATRQNLKMPPKKAKSQNMPAAINPLSIPYGLANGQEREEEMNEGVENRNYHRQPPSASHGCQIYQQMQPAFMPMPMQSTSTGYNMRHGASANPPFPNNSYNYWSGPTTRLPSTPYSVSQTGEDSCGADADPVTRDVINYFSTTDTSRIAEPNYGQQSKSAMQSSINDTQRTKSSEFLEMLTNTIYNREGFEQFKVIVEKNVGEVNGVMLQQAFEIATENGDMSTMCCLAMSHLYAGQEIQNLKRELVGGKKKKSIKEREETDENEESGSARKSRRKLATGRFKEEDFVFKATSKSSEKELMVEGTDDLRPANLRLSLILADRWSDTYTRRTPIDKLRKILSFTFQQVLGCPINNENKFS
ncbi:hypothetical protein WR25_25844 isoform B [Diploscapter pachys]|uniref:Uncharacterized protein n=1 Tax=Diploscapter pachys TaxID=2018661 RepID=A0A2A2JLZ3_9BILA|nr:hypothetical protein WR25_25844 isoform B [Diploscapter pachys]